MNIYEIDDAILALIDPETGEVLDFEAFEQLAMERERKLDNLACWVKNLDADIVALDTEAKKLIERRDAAKRKRDRLKSYLQEALAGEKRSTAQYAISYRATESVELTNETAVIAWLIVHDHEDALTYRGPDISKTAVKALLKAGEAVNGAELVKRQSMTIK